MDKELLDIMGYNNCRYVMLPIAGDSLSSNTKAEVAIEPIFYLLCQQSGMVRTDMQLNKHHKMAPFEAK